MSKSLFFITSMINLNRHSSAKCQVFGVSSCNSVFKREINKQLEYDPWLWLKHPGFVAIFESKKSKIHDFKTEYMKKLTSLDIQVIRNYTKKLKFVVFAWDTHAYRHFLITHLMRWSV